MGGYRVLDGYEYDVFTAKEPLYRHATTGIPVPGILLLRSFVCLSAATFRTAVDSSNCTTAVAPFVWF